MVNKNNMRIKKLFKTEKDYIPTNCKILSVAVSKKASINKNNKQ